MNQIAWSVLGVAVGVALATLMRSRPSKSFASGIAGGSDHGDRIGAESDQASQSARMQIAIDALPVGVVVANSAGEVVVRNRSSETMGDEAHVLVHAAIQHHLRAALRGIERSQTVELYGPPRRVVVVTAYSLGADGAVVTVEDVTERSRLDAIRTDFVANISHELKTPIGALAVLAETLVDEHDPDVLRRLAGKTVNEAHRVAKTIDDLLELSQTELSGEVSRQTLEVGSLIATAISRSHYLAEKREVRVEVGDVPSHCRIRGDQLQLESALGNLIDNAVKYSEAGGIVTVSADITGNAVVLQVKDEGIGIPSSDLDRIFERFYRVDRARSRSTGGTGLGLSIVRHVAQNHAGTVAVTSRVGEGSVFRLSLPNALANESGS